MVSFSIINIALYKNGNAEKYFMQLFLKIFSGIAKSVDPDQHAPLGSFFLGKIRKKKILQNAEQSDLGLHCLHKPFCLKLWIQIMFSGLLRSI